MAVTCLAVHILASRSPAGAQRQAADAEVLARAGAYVEQYFNRAQTVLSLESVRLQPLSHDLTASGRARELLFEVRAQWTPAPDEGAPPVAQVLRHLLEVDGRPPKASDRDSCMDPRAVTLEPLTMLLPVRQREYTFRQAGTDREGGMEAIVLEYRPLVRRPPVVEWQERCVSVDLDGGVRGRIWVVPETGQVLRLDEQSLGMVDIPLPPKQRRRAGDPTMTLERVDSSIRYRPVTFTEPAEILMLPDSIETIVIWRNAGVPRMRTWQSFSGYRRFVTGGRLVR